MTPGHSGDAGLGNEDLKGLKGIRHMALHASGEGVSRDLF